MPVWPSDADLRRSVRIGADATYMVPRVQAKAGGPNIVRKLCATSCAQYCGQSGVQSSTERSPTLTCPEEPDQHGLRGTIHARTSGWHGRCLGSMPVT